MQESGIKMEAKRDMDLVSMDNCFLSKARQISYTITTHPLKNPKSSPPVKEESQCPLTTTPCVLKSDHSATTSPSLALNDCGLAAASDPLAIKQESVFCSRPHKVNCIKSEKSPSPGLTTDLENFQDLTEWCHLRRRCAPKMSSSCTATDELNTPIVELDEFLFTIPTPIESNNDDGFSLFNINDIIIPQSDADFGMIDDGHQTHGGPVLATGTTSKYTIDDYYQYSNNNTINFLRDNKQGDGCSDIFIDNHNYNTLNYVWSPAKTTTTPPQHLDSADTEANIFITTPDETEHHVEIQPNTDHTSLKTPLRLDFTNLLMEKSTNSIPTINTPDVINTALELDKGFNLVRFINNDINTIEEPQSSSVTSPQELDDPDQSPSVSISNDPTYTISDSADDLETDDDDDYEPPGKKRNITTTKSKKSKTRKTPSVLVTSYDDSELSNVSSSVDPSPVLQVRRGRPPKRPVSVSSESCAAAAADTSELSRYRELRDKNNEASRRSRLNRKMKDQLLEEEAGELDDKNRRLKVQVSELERQLSTMRDNLMKLLLKK